MKRWLRSRIRPSSEPGLPPAPPEPPDGFADALKPGALAELAYLSGWWEVSVIKRTPAGHPDATLLPASGGGVVLG